MIDLAKLATGWTPGGVGIWVLVVIALVGWWKGLPAVLDAWSNSVARERAHREREIERLEAQIVASDHRHEECMTGQRKLREEMGQMQKDHLSEISRLQGLISGLVAQMRHMQLSTVDSQPMSPNSIPPEFAAMLLQIDKGDQIKRGAE